MQNQLAGTRVIKVEDNGNWLDSFFASKDQQFFWQGIHNLPKRWEKVIAMDNTSINVYIYFEIKRKSYFLLKNSENFFVQLIYKSERDFFFHLFFINLNYNIP